MVTYIRSDLDFILAQIKIAEAHAAGQPLFGPGGLVPAYTLSYGLRTVDGRDNNLLPGQEEWGAADIPFPELMDPAYRSADGTLFDPDGPGPAPAIPTSPNYNPSNDPNALVFDASLRTISNLIVDQTLGNPAAIMKALVNAGSAEANLTTVGTIQADIYAVFKPFADAAYQANVAATNAQAAANANPSDAALQAAAAAAADAATAADAALVAAREPRDAALAAYGIEMDGDNVHLPNIAPDGGLSAPFNSWFTLFGQFFDHGLDLVNKGGSGTVFVPLQPDDPLYVPGSQTNFMVLTRATVSAGPDGIMNTADDVRPVNTTTSFVDQNQTYTSHSSHQVFLRQYELDAAGKPVATGKLIEGGGAQPGGMATWGEVKAQSASMLGIKLTDFDVGNVPLLRTDQYGNFIPDANGMPQIIIGIGADGIPNTADDIVVSGNIAAPVDPTLVGALRIDHAFLADIAHDAVPFGKVDDGDIEIGLANPGNGSTEYDNELLDAHFIAGDGRANENIGLTAVHHIFHSEHNRLVEHTKETVLATNDLAFLNEWLAEDVLVFPITPAQISNLAWDGERLFQAAKFGTEMQYQHLVFEDFARKIQPNIDFFVVPDGYHADINPSIVAEFAHVVYRFGHSMLTETIDRFDPSFNADQIGLIQAFLNPVEFDAGHTIADGVSAGDIIRGMTRQVGNEIDEFVTSALRNNLLGLPLDLATINLARGRDTGVPSLNAARREFYQASNHAPELKPYESWVEFAGGLKNEASVINFIAAYGLHPLITGQTTVEGKRDAALTIIFGTSHGGLEVPPDALEFLNSEGPTWSNLANGVTRTGLDNIDLWIGGLAEKIMPFGGMLGSTFNFVFEVQLEQLQDGDRFYYLQRLDGLHLLAEMENNTFAKLILLNADAGHLPSDVFSTPGLILEVDRTKQYNPGLGETAGVDGILEDDPLTLVDESADNLGNDPTGGGILTQLVVRNNPATVGPDSNYLRYTGPEHVLLGGTDNNDILIASEGDDTLYGDAGNDRMEGGYGNDSYIGGDGDDIITDIGGDDIIRSGRGNDVINAGQGTDLVVGDEGQDFIVLGADLLDEAFGGVGNDFILGSKTTEQSMGGEGDDWIEVGAWTGAVGDNFDDQFAADSVIGHDVFHGDGGFDEFIGEGGDDIWVASLGRGKFDGMSGFDWATYTDIPFGINADLFRLHFDALPLPPFNAALDEYAFVEGVSGSAFNDEILGSDVTAADMPTEGARGSVLTAAGIALIAGLQDILGAGVTFFDGGNILLGGDGSDVFTGRGGDDIIDGDKWLNVRIAVMSDVGPNGGIGTVLAYHNSMTTLVDAMFAGTINAGQLKIVRSIETANGADDIDIAKYQGDRGEYAFSATADGQIIVSDVGVNQLDGTDRLRNIEKVQFATGDALNIFVGTAGNDTLTGTAQDDLMLGLGGNDVLNGGAGDDILVGGPSTAGSTATMIDNFNGAESYSDNNGAANFNGPWTETNDGTSTFSGGDIEIDSGGIRFDQNITGGEMIQRAANLSGAASATVSFAWYDEGLDAEGGGNNENVVFEAFNGTAWVSLATFGSNTTNNVLSNFSTGLSASLIGSFSNFRFRAEGDWENGENFFIDDFTITFGSAAETLNGGAGNDTYSMTAGDGIDVINELANEGAADRISILAPNQLDGGGQPVINPDTGLPIPFMSALSVVDDNTATQTGNLVITYAFQTGAAQTITVSGHFNGTNVQTGVELISFGGAVVYGYALGSDNYFISRLDPSNRDAGGVNASTNAITNAQQNVLAGENGVNDQITGGGLNDLIFGGTGDNDLFGGLGDDLLVGGNGAGDDDLLDGGADGDTMVGGNGNDTYIVDDLLDVVVEAAGQGADVVETLMAELSIENMANVENLSYEGVDADQFIGTGNSGANIISGGDLADTLSGLAGNDTLDGGLGADVMRGGADNDVYIVDDAGDVVDETAVGSSGVDRVESDVSYVLGAGVENLDLNNNAPNGTGNELNNIINGNGAANQLMGAAGNDTLNGDDGNDFLDGGSGNDILNGGDENDTIIGGAGNDTINVGNGVNTIVYNAAGFGADVIDSFDAAGGTPASQDRIDLSGLGVTAANFGNRVFESAGPGGGTIITIRENGAASAIQGTIQINGANNAAIDITDFTLAVVGATLGGATAANNTLNGTANNDLIDALAGNDTVNGNNGDDTIIGGLNGTGGPGADILNGGAGNDTFIWNANGSGATDGRDVIDGGTETAMGDTFVINGNASAEAYTIYTRAAWDALDGNNVNNLNGATEIVVTRNGTNFASVVAELREIEEIRINGADPSGASGAAGNDTFAIVGDFSGTNLRLNTVTIAGGSGSDNLDISGLSSSHRVVYSSGGGADQLIGTARPQDVIDMAGATQVSDNFVLPANYAPVAPALMMEGRGIAYLAHKFQTDLSQHSEGRFFDTDMLDHQLSLAWGDTWF